MKTPEAVAKFFEEKADISRYYYEEISAAMKSSLVDLYNYIVEGKGDLPKLYLYHYYDKHYTENVLKFGLRTYPERVLPLLFSIKEEDFERPRKAKFIADIISHTYKKIIPYIIPYEKEFLLRVDSFEKEEKGIYFEIIKELAKSYPDKHKPTLLYFCKTYLLKFKYDTENWYNRDKYYRYEESSKYLSEECILVLKEELSNDDYDQLFKEFPVHAPDISLRSIKYITEHFGVEAMPYLANIFKNNIDDSTEFTKLISEILTDYDWLSYSDKIWDFGSKLGLQNQSVLAKVLATQEKNAIENAKEYIIAKGGKVTLAYFVLGNIKTKESESIFETHFHQEKNDKKVRQIILPTAQNYLYKKPLTLEQVNEIIDKAEQRGALKWKQAFKEEELPDLFLKNGDKLNSSQIRFLFYRMSFIVDMKSDPEAKLLLHFINTEKSNSFANYLLETYLGRGSIAKEKYIMCLAGLLGDDHLLADLQKLFKQVYEAKRMKMTQYVIGTMALIGTDKALRFIEYVSRKFKSKAALLNATIEALENAADELGIDIYELSDRIIPDFGFDGLYKNIEVGEEEMRVFVAKDFKLQYITEDNKIRKSLPKAASKELKDELKVIQKEIREVNRAQKEKLEQYMVLERRWTYEDWEKFYLMNPVMFIYASTLVWGVFDKDNKVKEIFYVDEDASLLDFEDDDVEIDFEDDSLRIGMIHNLRITEEQKQNWTDKFYELEINQPFEQLSRKSFVLDKADEENGGIIKYHSMKASRGARAVHGYFEKRGWRKEVSDGGGFDLSKSFDKENIYAFLNIFGLCVGYYDEEVEFYNITFDKIGESNWKNNIKLKDVPPIIFSEVTADMEGIIKQKEDIIK